MTIVHTEKYVIPLTVQGRVVRDTIKEEWEKMVKSNIESGITEDGFYVKYQEDVIVEECK